MSFKDIWEDSLGFLLRIPHSMTYSLCGDSAQMGESRSLRSQIIVTVRPVNQHLLESVDSYYELASTVLFFHLTSLFAAYVPKLNNSGGAGMIFI